MSKSFFERAFNYEDDRRESVNMDDLYAVLTDKSVPDNRLEKILQETIKNPDFIEHIFPIENGKTADGLSEKMYSAFIKKRVMKAIRKVLVYEDPESFSRSIGAWLYSVMVVAIEVHNTRTEEYEKKFGNVSKSEVSKCAEANEEKIALEKYNKVINKLSVEIGQIVRKEAKKMATKTGIPKEMARVVLLNVPDVERVNSYRVAGYLDRVLTAMYKYIDAKKLDTSDVNWKEFFIELFGEKNLVEVATFILLEGVHREDAYGTEVSDTFTNLTMFALKVLEKAPEMTKNQMIELYTKRIGTMFANKTFDLRANLLDLDEDKFPTLCEAVSHYADKIREIVNHKF